MKFWRESNNSFLESVSKYSNSDSFRLEYLSKLKLNFSPSFEKLVWIYLSNIFL